METNFCNFSSIENEKDLLFTRLHLPLFFNTEVRQAFLFVLPVVMKFGFNLLYAHVEGLLASFAADTAPFI